MTKVTALSQFGRLAAMCLVNKRHHLFLLLEFLHYKFNRFLRGFQDVAKRAMVRIVFAILGPEREPLNHLLNMLNLRCSDPRDRAFALLGPVRNNVAAEFGSIILNQLLKSTPALPGLSSKRSQSLGIIRYAKNTDYDIKSTDSSGGSLGEALFPSWAGLVDQYCQ